MGSIASHKRAIGWTPNQPDHAKQCSGCTHAHWEVFANRPALRCIKHGFFTFSHAVCETDHTPRGSET